MLLAYVDEIGETGAFVAPDHPKFKTSPAFGYAGFVLPAENARAFGGLFTARKREVFKTEIEHAEHPGRWEKKGASIFRPKTLSDYPQQLRVFNGLVDQVRRLGGHLFYYANEKPLGTPKQTQLDSDEVETRAMQETMNRIARHADKRGKNVLVMIDQINEKQRAQRLPVMYGHIFSRAAEFPEMKRIVEPPMHVDSALSSNIQFADWVAGALSRAIDYQLIQGSPHRWITTARELKVLRDRNTYTHESKLHLWQRACNDPCCADVAHRQRPLYPSAEGRLMVDQVGPEIFRRMKAAAERAGGKTPVERR